MAAAEPTGFVPQVKASHFLALPRKQIEWSQRQSQTSAFKRPVLSNPPLPPRPQSPGLPRPHSLLYQHHSLRVQTHPGGRHFGCKPEHSIEFLRIIMDTCDTNDFNYWGSGEKVYVSPSLRVLNCFLISEIFFSKSSQYVPVYDIYI